MFCFWPRFQHLQVTCKAASAVSHLPRATVMCGEPGANTRPPAALDRSLCIPITEHTLGRAQHPR